MTLSPRFTWNHRVHEQWGECRLCVWRLKFNPTFDEDRIKVALLEVFRAAGATSYAVYELLGYYDILLRIWLPNAISLLRMEEMIGDSLFEFDYEDSEYFEVSQIIRHWVWEDRKPDGTAGVAEPDPTELLSKPDAGLLNRMNDIVSGDSEVTLTNEREQELLDRWLRTRVLTELKLTTGFKYFIIIKRPSAAGSRQARRNLVGAIAKVCDDVASHFASETSLYDGRVEYLVTGRFGAEDFHEGMARLISGLNESGLSRMFLSRTFTAIALQPHFFFFQDRLATQETTAPPWPHLEEALLLGETDAVEFKSSFCANVNRWIHDDAHVLILDKKLSVVVAKTVAGMLNSREYGTVVLGVGERSHLLKNLTEDELTSVEQLLEPYPKDRDLVIFGTELDRRVMEVAAWDTFIRSVQQTLSSSIQPDPAPYLHYVREEYLGRELLVIRTAPPASEQDWFYIEEEKTSKFFVRFNAFTAERRGRDQDMFKNSRPGRSH